MTPRRFVFSIVLVAGVLAASNACNTISGLNQNYTEVDCLQCADGSADSVALQDAPSDSADTGDGACVLAPTVPSFDTEACDTCAQTKCCDSVNACYTDKKCTSFISCLSQCGGSATECVDRCGMNYPDGLPLFQTFDNCLRTTCNC